MRHPGLTERQAATTGRDAQGFDQVHAALSEPVTQFASKDLILQAAASGGDTASRRCLRLQPVGDSGGGGGIEQGGASSWVRLIDEPGKQRQQIEFAVNDAPAVGEGFRFTKAFRQSFEQQRPLIAVALFVCAGENAGCGIEQPSQTR